MWYIPSTFVLLFLSLFHLIAGVLLHFLFAFSRGPQEHRQTHGNAREPLLENITSEYDLELFRKAQARASEDLVMMGFHISISTFFLAF